MANEYFKNKSYLIKTREFIKKSLRETAPVIQYNMSLITSGCIPVELFYEILYFNAMYLYLNIINRIFYLGEFLKENENYYKLKNLYDNYITEIAKLFNIFGNIDMYEISVLYNILLYRGTFSIENEFIYHDYLIDKLSPQEIHGTRIASGTGICFQISANLIDIYLKLGYDAFDIGCCTGTHNKIIKKIKATHSITGILDNKNMLIVDATWKRIGFFNDKHHKTITMIPIDPHKSNEVEFYIPTFIKHLLNKANHEKIIGISNLPNYIQEKGLEEMSKSYDKINALVEQNKLVIQEWKEKNFALIQEIYQLEKELIDYKDQPTRKLKR